MSKSKQKIDELLADINRANEAIKHARVSLVAKFSEPLVTNAHNAPRLAKSLSEKFKTLKVSISYESGDSAIYAEPTFREFQADPNGHEHYVEQKAQEALAAMAKIDTYWPSFSEVQAYARGFNEGGRAVEELERTIKDLQERGNRRNGYMMGWQPFFGPYGG